MSGSLAGTLGSTASAASSNGGWRRLNGSPSTTPRTSSSNGFANRGTQQSSGPATRSSNGWQRLDGPSNRQNGGARTAGQSGFRGNGFGPVRSSEQRIPDAATVLRACPTDRAAPSCPAATCPDFTLDRTGSGCVRRVSRGRAWRIWRSPPQWRWRRRSSKWWRWQPLWSQIGPQNVVFPQPARERRTSLSGPLFLPRSTVA